MKHAWLSKLIAGAAIGFIGVANASTLPAGASPVLTVAYPSVCAFDSGPLATEWWNQVKTDFTNEYPNVTVQYIPIPGSYPDYVDKLSSLYRSPSTAPDVAEMPSADLGVWSSSGYLLPMNTYLKTSSWFHDFPKVIQGEGEFDGNIYAVSAGENDSGLMYNKVLFKKAGIPVPWKPMTWQDVITAAVRVQRAAPSVMPLWLNAGTGSGADGLLQGINDFIDGSSTPTIQTKNGQLVIDSAGIRAALDFYHQVYADGLGASKSAILSPNALIDPLSLFRSGRLAIAVAPNSYGNSWTKFISAPYWPAAGKTIGVARLPNESGTGFASTLSGWDLAISSETSAPQTAYDFINVAQGSTNMIDAANWAGWVPPVQSDWSLPRYKNFAPFFNADFAKALSYGTETPPSANYPIWAEGMSEATGDFVENPRTTVAQALRGFEAYMTHQLGASGVASLS
jgi:multiple sugar transport system substrate-binding protein